MPAKRRARKTGLQRGDVAAIARRLGLSVQHVDLVAKRKRVGSEDLTREIERVRQERAAEQGALAASA